MAATRTRNSSVERGNGQAGPDVENMSLSDHGHRLGLVEPHVRAHQREPAPSALSWHPVYRSQCAMSCITAGTFVVRFGRLVVDSINSTPTRAPRRTTLMVR